MSWLLLGLPVGLIFLYFGSDWMVDGAKKMAIRLGVKPFVVGLTVVAMGLSAPEVATTLASSSNPQLIIGHIVGSNIANIGLAIGVAAIIYPIVCRFRDIRFELYFLIAAMLIVSAMALTGSLGVFEGMILLVALVIFIYNSYRRRKVGCSCMEDEESPEVQEIMNIPMVECWKCLALVCGGILFLFLGATAFVNGAVELADMIGMPELMTGLVVVAFGVCLPELCVCIAAARRKENEILVSNIIGSVVFNCFFALAFGVLFTSVPVTFYTLVFHLPVMLIMGFLLTMFIKGGNKITRLEGVVLLSIYVTYIALMVIFQDLTHGLVEFEEELPMIIANLF